jgi:MFS family permease
MPSTTTETTTRAGDAIEKVRPYHWLVVIIASCGWLFDCMDQRLFVLAREPALTELLAGNEAALATLKTYIGYATTAMILGWATGGIIFGMMSDKVGRVKTMVLTLLIYSGFTGLSGFAHSWIDFTIYRFLVGLGVGGMFGAATTLVAESVPSHFRAVALGSLQALSATGNILGSLVSLGIPPGSENFWGDMAGWRVLFFIGIVPSLLIVPIVFLLREPEAWRLARAGAAASTDKKAGSPLELFTNPRWRRNTLVGLMLGLSGMIGLWGIGFYSPELISVALEGAPQEQIDSVRAWGTALQDVGAFLGMVAFTFIASYFSRRLAFLMAFALCLGVTAFVFNSLNDVGDVYWMLPMMGFAQLAVYAGYSIYFPELFPTRMRGTGVSFCYNTVRYLAAPFPILLGYLTANVFAHTESPFRTAAMVMSLVYLLGIVALIWAPETKGQALPED